MVIAIIVVVAIIVIAVLYWIAKRNSFVAARNRVDESWSGIDVQLKRRHDLVPNLVETVKGYASHESAVFEKTSKARADAMSAQSVGDTAKAENQLTGALTDLRAVAENYPELRATENFQQLSRNLSELEDEIQASRRIYNSNVQSYNTGHPTVPGLDHRQPGRLHRNASSSRSRTRRPRAGLGQLRQIAELFVSFGHVRDHRSDPLDLRELRVHLRPRDRRSRRRNPTRNPVRGHPQGLVLPGLRRPHERLPPPRARRGLEPAQTRSGSSRRMSVTDFDWVVVGSGFGGSVSALRLAEKGYSVRGARVRQPVPR